MRHLEAKDYRSFAELDVDFHSGINIIVGQSDNGKSNIVRMLHAATFNAVGDGFVRHGQKQASVTLDDVTWRKGSGTNEFVVDGTVLSGVGSGSPDEVLDSLSIHPMGTGHCINFQRQLDPYFILGYKDSDVADIIASLSDIQKLYEAVALCSTDLKRSKSSVSQTEGRLSETSDKLGELDWLREARASYSTTSARFKKMRKEHSRHAAAKGLVVEIRESRTELKKVSGELESLEDLPDVDNIEDHSNVDALITAIYKVISDSKGLQGVLTGLEPLEGLTEAVNALDTREVSALERATGCLARDEIALNVVLSKLESCEKDLAHAEDLFSEMCKNGVCPITQQPLPEDCRKLALKSV